MRTISFVEGNLQLGIELAPGTLERLRGNLANLEKGINLKVNVDPAPLKSAAGASDNLTKSVQGTANALSEKLGGAARASAATFGVLAAAGGAALVGIATKAVMAGKEFNVLQQQVRASLTAILGTTAAANGLLAQVNKLNDTSPFPRSAFLSATQQLVGFGVQAQKVVPIIDAVQNAVAGIGGNANDIQMFTRAFSQIQSQGRLTGDVLFSLGEKGIDAAAIIGKQMGQTGQEIKDAVTAGTIDSSKAIDALTVGLKTKFNGAVENVGKSFLGATDRVHARLRDIGADITKAFINPLGGGAAVDGLNNIAVGLSNIRKNVITGLLPGITSMADLFVKATEAFKNFTANIKTDQVQKFLEIFKMATPLIAFFGTSLVKSISGSIPILSTFTGALSGPVIALTTLALSIPAVRDGVISLGQSLAPIVAQLLPTFASLLTNVMGTVNALAPIIVGLAQTFASILGVVAPIVNVLVQFGNQTGILGGLITFLVARMIILKLTTLALGGTFSNLSAIATKVIASMMGGFSGVGGVAGLAGKAVSGLSGAISGIGGVTTFLVLAGTLMSVISNRASEATRNAAALAASIEKGRNLSVLSDQVNAFKDINTQIDLQKQKIDEVNGRLLSFTPSSRLDRDAAKKKIAALEEERNKIIQIREVQNDVLTAVSNQTGETLADVLSRATAAGIDFQNLKFDQGVPTIEKLVSLFKEIPAALEDATAKAVDRLKLQADALDKVRSAGDTLKASQRSLADLQRTAAGDTDAVTRATQALTAAREAGRAAADKVALAEISLAAAQRGVTDATDRLNQLVTTRNRLLADTGREAREVADAEATLARTGMTLIDQDERRIELQQDLERLAREGPDKLAAADRSIERAKIALNTATRDELTLLKETNKHQTSQVDLKGLSVEQIKLKLAGVRAELDSQRTSRGTLKTQQQINDEAKTASLNRLDAEQGLKDAIQGRTDLENEQNVKKREDEEGLKSLAIDHEDSLRRQTEQQTALSILRSGDTQTARDLKQLNNEIVGATDDVKKAVIAVHTEEDGLKQAKIDQRNLTIDIRDREREVAGALNTQKEHITDIKSAQQKVKEDALAYKEAIATASGDHKEINRLLLERIGLNNTILKQNPLLLRQLAESIVGPALTTGGHGGPGAMQRETKINTLIDIITNHPEQLLDTLRNLGLQFADGAVVNSATFATIGEAGREVVLPLTRPARLEELLSNSQVLPPVLAALGRISLPGRTGSSLSPSADSIIKPLSGSGGTNVVVRREDGPMTYAQAQSIIGLLKENGKATISVTAPITVESSTNEDELVRKISRRVERQVNEILDKRRR